MQGIEKFLADLADFVWGLPIIILLFGTHLYLTFRLSFIQRYLGKGIKLSITRSTEGRATSASSAP
jgi:AGCS family alanine or glycine:cation symporter